MQILDYIAISMFIVMIIAANWKGSEFLALPLKTKLIIAGSFAIPWAAWIIAHHLTT